MHKRGSFLFFQVPRTSHRLAASLGTGASEPSTDAVWPAASRAHQRETKHSPNAQWRLSRQLAEPGGRRRDGITGRGQLPPDDDVDAGVDEGSNMVASASLEVRERSQRQTVLSAGSEGERRRGAGYRDGRASATSAPDARPCFWLLQLTLSLLKSPGSRYAGRHMIEQPTHA